MIFLPTFFIKEKSWSFARGANETMACAQDLINTYTYFPVIKKMKDLKRKVIIKTTPGTMERWNDETMERWNEATNN